MKKLLLILLCIPLLFSNCKKEDIINNDTDCSGPDIWPFNFTANYQNQHFDPVIGAPAGDTIDFTFSSSKGSDVQLSASGYPIFCQFSLNSSSAIPFRLIGKWEKWQDNNSANGGSSGLYTPYEMIIDLNKSLDNIQDGEEFIFPSTGNEITFIPNGSYNAVYNPPFSTFTPVDGDPQPVSSGTLVFSKDPCYYYGTLEFIIQDPTAPYEDILSPLTVTATFRLRY